MVSAPDEMARLDLDGFDGVLAFGEALSEVYRRRGWGRDVFTWHEAADSRVFRPARSRRASATWSGSATGATASAPPSCANSWSSRSAALGSAARVHGVRYPADALGRAGSTPASITAGYLPNFRGAGGLCRSAV